VTKEKPESGREEQPGPPSVFRPWYRQITFVLLGLSITLLGSVVLLLVVFQGYSDKAVSNSLSVALLGGIFGGSTRALYMFILEMQGKGWKKDNFRFYLERWFLYLLKPFMGGATGVLFFLGVNLGLVRALTQQAPSVEFLPVILVSAVGGIFFEEVFKLLQKLVGTESDAASDK